MSTEPTTPTRRQAIRHSIAAQMMGAVLPTLVRQGGVASLLIIALVGEEAELAIGLAFLIMQWSMVARVVVAPRVDLTWRKRFLVRWMGISSVASLLLLAAPLAGMAGLGQEAVWVLLAMLAAYFCTMQAGVAAWFPLLYVIVPAQLRGRYFGNMRRAWQLTSFGAVLLSGALLGRDPGMALFLAVLAPAVLLQFGRAVMVQRLPDPPPARPHGDRLSWRDMLVPLRDRSFVGFVVFVLLMTMVQHAAMPFVVPFLRTELDFPAGITMYGTGCFGLGSVLSLVRWGRLADRAGTRFVFLLSGLTAIAGLVAIAAVPSYSGHALVATIAAVGGMVLAGAGTAGIEIAYTVRLMRMAPADRPGPYLNLSQAVIGLVSGAAAAGTGALLRWLPDDLTVAGMGLSSFRLYFVLVGAGILLVLVLVRWLPRLGEPPMVRRRSR